MNILLTFFFHAICTCVFKWWENNVESMWVCVCVCVCKYIYIYYIYYMRLIRAALCWRKTKSNNSHFYLTYITTRRLTKRATQQHSEQNRAQQNNERIKNNSSKLKVWFYFVLSYHCPYFLYTIFLSHVLNLSCWEYSCRKIAAICFSLATRFVLSLLKEERKKIVGRKRCDR